MKNLFLIFTLFFGTVLFAQQDSINPERVTYEFYKAKTIIHINNEGSVYPEIKDGNMVVFQYNKHHAENPMISDDELHESLMFEVDSTWRNFVFKKKMALSKATYQLGCFCIGRGYHIIDGGTIRGKKLANGNYYITADVYIKFETGVKKKIKFKGEFKPVNAG
ncbi:MAG: hypothetical protein KBE91_02000 [Bacteroidia bacterium]|nr:hypothetical protein [Bacteroidia bacterium]MBP9688355.1 hypothetical protein [Bacteroidia bacterium]